MVLPAAYCECLESIRPAPRPRPPAPTCIGHRRGRARQLRTWRNCRTRPPAVPKTSALLPGVGVDRIGDVHHRSTRRRSPWTLARKHDPTLLIVPAREVQGIGEIVVVSEGCSSTSCRRLPRRRAGRPHTRPFQPYERPPKMSGSANVLLTLLTAEVSSFSVPSKVMTYLVAERPIVASMPLDNPRPRSSGGHGADLVVDVDDRDGFVAFVRWLLDDPDFASRLGANCRAHVEGYFDLGRIGDRFEAVLSGVGQSR